jgi:hypothetical protein
VGSMERNICAIVHSDFSGIQLSLSKGFASALACVRYRPCDTADDSIAPDPYDNGCVDRGRTYWI